MTEVCEGPSGAEAPALEPTKTPKTVLPVGGHLHRAQGDFRAVGIASTHPLFGASHYARKLNSAMGIPTLASEQSTREIIREIESSHPDICHLQFEYRTFGGSLRTLLVLPTVARRIAGRSRLVVTIHGLLTREGSTRWPDRFRLFVYRSLIRRVARSAAGFTVFSQRMRAELESTYGIPDATVIPHGCDSLAPSQGAAVPPYLLFFGFLRPSKGVLELLAAFSLVAPSYPDLTLIIAGGQAKGYESNYIDRIERAVSLHPFRDRISLKKGFIDWSEKDRLARSATLIVLPYRDSTAEVSGVVHDVAASGVPIVCSNIPRFAELAEGIEAIHVSPDPSSIAAGIQRVLSDPLLRTRLSEGLISLAQRESWPEVARVHLEFFEKILTRQNAGYRPRD